MKIFVAGGGISGLATSIFLHRLGHEVLLIEKSHRWRNIGYVIFLWPNGLEILSQLDLRHSLVRDAYELRNFEIRDKNGKILKNLPFFQIFRSYGPTISIERETLHKALRDKAKNIPTKFDTTITDLKQQKSEVEVTLSNNFKDNFEMVIGADGTHSSVRDEVFGSKKIVFYNWAAWMVWVDPKIPLPPNIILMISRGKGFTSYPAPDGKRCGIFILSTRHGTPDEPQERVELLQNHFKNFGWLMPQILDTIKEPLLMYHDDLVRVNMHEWYRGRVVLVGDAEHALSPLLGMGGSMALEDAYVLAHEIHNSPSDLNKAFRNYVLKRQPRTDIVVSHDRKLWRLLNIQSVLPEFSKNIILRVLSTAYFTDALHDIFSHKITNYEAEK